MDIDRRINDFRLASRELFNGHFRHDAATASIATDFQADAWTSSHRFSEVQDLLFEKLVLEPSQISGTYGLRNPRIVVLLTSEFAPIMVRRSPGLWDYPVSRVSSDARLEFISFWDWDELAYRDNRYAHVYIAEWPAHPEAIGREALIETHYVHYREA